MPGRKPVDQEFVEYVVKSIVDYPDKVKAERKVDEMGVLITLNVDPADMGSVIGKAGQTAHSLRTLLRVVGAKNNARVNLKITEPEGGKNFVPKTSEEAPAEEAPAKKESASEVDDLKL